MGIVFAAVSTTPPSSMAKASAPSPRAISFGSGKLTVHSPLPSTFAGTRATSAPSTRAIAVTFAPAGTPPSARLTSRVAVTVSPGP
jgi:hypothetical protein